MRACPRCGEENGERARFCQACGERLQTGGGGEERKLVTVLFADLVGSTALGERLDPERLRDVLRAYFAAMRAEIEAEGGTVEKFIGDAVVAAFGVPVAGEDDAARAVRAAGRMLDRLDRLNLELGQRRDELLALRVGVATGPALASTDPRPGEPLATGDVMNVAARLQAAAEPGTVLVAQRTARAARSFSFADVGPVAVRGRDASVRAARLRGPSSAPERGLPGARAPLLGRRRELERLEALLAETVERRRPRLVTLLGDAGIGKSRLARELLASEPARRAGALELTGRCRPHRQGAAFRPLSEMIGGLCGLLDTDEAAVALAKLRRALGGALAGDGAGDPAAVIEAVAYSLGIAGPAAPPPGATPREVGAATRRAWRAVLSALARRSPVIAVVDDIHWAEPELLEVLEDAAAGARGPLLLVCTSRPDLAVRRPGWGSAAGGASIRLDPLGQDDASELVGVLLEAPDLPDRARAQILERAEGNPFFIEEIVRKLLDEGSVVGGESGRRRTAGSIRALQIPDTVQAVLAARIDLLAPRHKRILQLAAVVGRVFWTGAVGRLLDDGAADLDEVLDALEGRELVAARADSSVAGDEQWVFEHVLTRDVAYEALPRRERAAAHARVAAWLADTAFGQGVDGQELLASHRADAHACALQAGLDADAVERARRLAFRQLLAASRGASARLLTTSAARFAERAHAIAATGEERAEALEQLGETAFYDLRGDDVWRFFRGAVTALLAASSDDGARIARLCARAVEVPIRHAGAMYLTPGPEEIGAFLRTGLERAGEGDSETLVRLLTAESAWPFRGLRDGTAAYVRSDGDGASGAAQVTGERACAMALRLGRHDLASAALDALGGPYIDAGDWRGLRGVIERRLAIVDRIDDPWQVQDVFNMLAWHAYVTGLYRECAGHAQQGIERWPGDPVGLANFALPWRTLARHRLGDWDGCLDDFERSEAVLRERLDRLGPFAARHLGAAALVRQHRGDHGEVDRILAVVAGHEQRSGRQLHWVRPALARIAGLRGRPDEAREILAGGPGGAHEVEYAEAICDLVADAGWWDDAAEAVAAAREIAERGGLRALPLCADRLEGRAALAGGEPARAADLLGAAAAGYAGLGARWDEAITRLHLAGALRATGEHRAAADAAEAARAVFEALGARSQARAAGELAGRSG